eukprot:118577-Amphidinium_carterae.4
MAGCKSEEDVMPAEAADWELEGEALTSYDEAQTWVMKGLKSFGKSVAKEYMRRRKFRKTFSDAGVDQAGHQPSGPLLEVMLVSSSDK